MFSSPSCAGGGERREGGVTIIISPLHTSKARDGPTYPFRPTHKTDTGNIASPSLPLPLSPSHSLPSLPLPCRLTGRSPRSSFNSALPLEAGEEAAGFPEGEEEEEEGGGRGERRGCWGLEVRATDIGRGEFLMAVWTCSGVGAY